MGHFIVLRGQASPDFNWEEGCGCSMMHGQYSSRIINSACLFAAIPYQAFWLKIN